MRPLNLFLKRFRSKLHLGPLHPKYLYCHLLRNVLSFSFSEKMACLDVATYANLLSRGRNPSQAGIFVLLKILTIAYLRKSPSSSFVLFHFWVSSIFRHTNVLLRGQLYLSIYRFSSFSLGKTSSSVGHYRYNMVLAVDFSVYSYFVVNIWSRNFTFLFLWGIVSVCSWFF